MNKQNYHSPRGFWAALGWGMGQSSVWTDRHILVNSNQQTRDELEGQLCALRNRGKLSEIKNELLFSVCFRFEPVSLRPNSHWTVSLQPNYYWTISLHDILCHKSIFLRENLMKTLGSSPAHSTAICVTQSKSSLCSYTLASPLLLVWMASHYTELLITAHFTQPLTDPQRHFGPG